METGYTFDNIDHFINAQASLISEISKKIYEANNSPVTVLDLASGNNNLNSEIVRLLARGGIKYTLVMSDLSPTHLKDGFENLEKNAPSEIGNIKCVLADSRDLKKELTEVPIWGNPIKIRSLEDVLRDPSYQFLQTGYKNGQRIIDFSDSSFDIIIGRTPYGNLEDHNGHVNPDYYKVAVKESARVLRLGGYHIITETHVEEVRSYLLRSLYTLRDAVFDRREKSFKDIISEAVDAVSRAKSCRNEDIKNEIGHCLKPIIVNSVYYTHITKERLPQMAIQNEDLLRIDLMVHRKAT